MFRITPLFFCLLFLGGIHPAFSQKADILIKNGKIIDGTGNSWYYGDIAVKKDKILAVGYLPHLKANAAIK